MPHRARPFLPALLLCGAVLVPAHAFAQQTPAVQALASGATPQLQAVRRTEPIVLDGRLDEAFHALERAISSYQELGSAEAVGRCMRLRSRFHWWKTAR